MSFTSFSFNAIHIVPYIKSDKFLDTSIGNISSWNAPSTIAVKILEGESVLLFLFVLVLI